MRKYMSGITFTEDVEDLQTGEKLNTKLENIDNKLDDIQNDVENAITNPASTTKDGLMSAEDKRKLDEIDENANNYKHPTTHSVDMISGLAEVATSGSYDDLTDKPTADDIPGLAEVAISGSYNDLSEQPEIPGLIDSADSTSVKDAPTANALRMAREFMVSVQKNSAEKTFDSLIEQEDTTATANINTDGSIIEAVRSRSTGALKATRLSTFSPESDTISISVKFYETDGETLERRLDTTVSFNESDLITYETV